MLESLPVLRYWLADIALGGSFLFAMALLIAARLRRAETRVPILRTALAACLAVCVLAALPGRIRVSLWMPSTMTASVRSDGTIDASPAAGNGQQARSARSPRAESGNEAARWATRGVELFAVAGGLAACGWLVIGLVGTLRLLWQSRPAPRAWRQFLASLAPGTDQRLRRAEIPHAAAIGLLRSFIVLPQSFPAQLDAEPRAAILHEWEHIRRGDLWTSWILRVLLVAFYWNPLYWMLRRRLEFDQELLADVAAARAVGRVEYAAILLEWSRRSPGGPALSIGAAGGGSLLKRRITELLTAEPSAKPREQSRARWGIVALTGLALTVSLCTLKPAPSPPANRAVALAGIPAVAPAPDRAAEGPTAIDSGSRYFASLGDGVTLELVAVLDRTGPDARWWRPDGTALDCLPATGSIDYLRLGDDQHEMLVRVDAPHGAQVDLAALAATADVNDATLRIGLGVGAWTTQHAIPSNDARELAGAGLSACGETDEAVVILKRTMPTLASSFRVLAVDRCGARHSPTRAEHDGDELLTSFEGLAVETIEQFEIQVRPQRWVEFRNISMSPGRRTHVRVLTPEMGDWDCTPRPWRTPGEAPG